MFVEQCIANILRKFNMFTNIYNFKTIDRNDGYDIYFHIKTPSIQHILIKEINNIEDMSEYSCDIIYLPAHMLVDEVKDISSKLKEGVMIEFYDAYSLIERRTEFINNRDYQKDCILSILKQKKNEIEELEKTIFKIYR